MANDLLTRLLLRKGAVVVIGGDAAHNVAKRSAFFIRQLRPRLRVLINMPDGPIDHLAVNLIIPSFNVQMNRWLDRDGIGGVITAKAADSFTYIDALSGVTTEINCRRSHKRREMRFKNWVTPGKGTTMAKQYSETEMRSIRTTFGENVTFDDEGNPIEQGIGSQLQPQVRPTSKPSLAVKPEQIEFLRRWLPLATARSWPKSSRRFCDGANEMPSIVPR